MKTEIVLGSEVVRVDEINRSCCATDGNVRISCKFFDGSCLIKGKHACDNKPVIFIRPDQIHDYLALKLVS